jgi:hypothetical protein
MVLSDGDPREKEEREHAAGFDHKRRVEPGSYLAGVRCRILCHCHIGSLLL